MDDRGITKKRNYNEYYQDELFFLREMGKEFSESHPMLAHFLLEAGSDPDVERLLEGFAFLTGRIRQKLDDELPKLTHTMMGMICPHYLRPIPAMSIVEFEPQRTLRGKYLIPQTKTELESSPVGNTRCRFRTCYDVELLPIGLEDVVLEGQQLKITFRILNGVQFSTLGLDKIRLNLHGDPTIQYELYNMFCRNIQKVSVRSSNGSDQEVVLDKTNVKPVGFDESEGMLPYPPNSFLGYRVIQEYFSFPDKFLFIDVTGLENTSKLGIQDTFDIVFQLSRRPNENVRITKDNIHLNCTPVINLFSRSSEPIRVENERTEYRLRPEGPNSNHYEVYSVDKVFGMIPGTAQQYEYKAFYSFTHSLSERGNIYYQTRLRDSVTSENSTETYILFINADQSVAVPTTEIISSELTCINRQLTEQLRLGDIKIPTSNSPEVARFRNITNVTPTIYSPIGGSLHWKLISHLTLNRLSITSKEALQGILSLYNFQALVDRGIGSENERRINSISNVQGVQKDRLYRGTPIRGMEIQLDMQENNFINDGDMYLFCCMLNEFLALYSNINSFSQLTAKGANRGEVQTWPMRIGKQTIL
ncbi:MAG: type secretion system protein ImpG [Candidatus Poribacteria bacterium]|nr:type secretion system protein ImpG [Candidatus Poribacteria bacterium]